MHLIREPFVVEIIKLFIDSPAGHLTTQPVPYSLFKEYITTCFLEAADM